MISVWFHQPERSKILKLNSRAKEENLVSNCLRFLRSAWQSWDLRCSSGDLFSFLLAFQRVSFVASSRERRVMLLSCEKPFRTCRNRVWRNYCGSLISVVPASQTSDSRGKRAKKRHTKARSTVLWVARHNKLNLLDEEIIKFLICRALSHSGKELSKQRQWRAYTLIQAPNDRSRFMLISMLAYYE